MEPKVKFFYSEGCDKCESLKPIINEFSKALKIESINTDEDIILTENYDVEWVPSLVVENELGKIKFEGVDDIKDFLKKLTS
jgi:thiol-disulfide isomerase/thioredoxin